MASTAILPQTFDERLVFWTIVGTWLFWLLGALYLVSPVLGWLLVLRGAINFGTTERESRLLPLDGQLTLAIWVVAMLAMLLALLIGHANFSLGLAQTIKSGIGWLKGWALLSAFIIAGALLNVRPEIIYRASNILALQTLCLVPIFVASPFIGIPQTLYVSPLSILGGPGPEFFSVELFSVDPVTWSPRWRFFAPWAPAAGMIAVLSFIFAVLDRATAWRTIGIIAALTVCLMSKSRLAILSIPALILLLAFLTNLNKPATYVIGAVLALAAAVSFDIILDTYYWAVDTFSKTRADSSYVRATLQNIARHRWLTEAPIWGHGIVERGPHLVQYMPIGSHHTWNGLLYIKGAVGFAALAIALSTTALILIAKAQRDKLAQAALAVILVIFFYSFGENLEILVYLIWPGLLLVGAALKRPTLNPFFEECAHQAPADRAVAPGAASA